MTRQSLEKYLGPSKYYPEMDKEHSQVGLSTGLAWTQVGGEVLYVEASLINGKGEMILTGQLGEVMQESARAALSYARANIDLFNVKDEIFDNRDIHIHASVLVKSYILPPELIFFNIDSGINPASRMDNCQSWVASLNSSSTSA